MGFIGAFWRREPVVFVASLLGILDALLVLAGKAGVLHITPDIWVGILGVEAALGTFIQRSQVTPVADPKLEEVPGAA